MEKSQKPSPSLSTDTDYTYTNPEAVSSLMETDDNNISNSATSRTRYSSVISVFRFLQAPLSTLVSDNYPLLLSQNTSRSSSTASSSSNSSNSDSNNGSVVSIRIINQERDHVPNDRELGLQESSSGIEEDVREITSSGDAEDGFSRSWSGSSSIENENSSASLRSPRPSNNTSPSDQQRYHLQRAARLIEQIIPFPLLLLLVFIRQHLQGFFVTIFISAFLFKSNGILKKQAALKGERKLSVLIGYFVVYMLHVIGIYWWYQNDDILNPLIMVPPKAIPPFWHAIFTILVNDTMVRQAAMAFKLILLMYYRNARGHNLRKQGQMLTLIEYALLLYRALLPAPVWYRFFLNKDYGNLFSSLITGLYLTFKLTSVVAKVRSLSAALKALSPKKMHYGSYATLEQVTSAGDMCGVCQEKVNVPVLLFCKHIFCEDCVSEWFERERTCPLCRALVRPADMQSYCDGSTSLSVQLF